MISFAIILTWFSFNIFEIESIYFDVPNTGYCYILLLIKIKR